MVREASNEFELPTYRSVKLFLIVSGVVLWAERILCTGTPVRD